jgi:hypothetical protein
MPWTVPKSWTTQELVTSANFNTHLRDNLAWLASDHPRCIVSRSTGQTIGSGAIGPITLDDADTVDVGDMHNPGVNPTRVTIPSGGGGFYHFSGTAEWTASASGRRHLLVRKNGSTTIWSGQFTAPPASLWLSDVTGNAQLVAGDYIELCGSQDSGSTLTIGPAMFAVEWRAT